LRFHKQKQGQENKADYVSLNENANPTVIRQLSIRFTDRRGNDAWSYIRRNGLALSELMDGSVGFGLANPYDCRRVAVALGTRFIDEDGTSALEYLKNHRGMAQELFVHTAAYTDAVVQKYSAITSALKEELRRNQTPADA
jgi:hypothetical protein